MTTVSALSFLNQVAEAVSEKRVVKDSRCGNTDERVRAKRRRQGSTNTKDDSDDDSASQQRCFIQHIAGR